MTPIGRNYSNCQAFSSFKLFQVYYYYYFILLHR